MNTRLLLIFLSLVSVSIATAQRSQPQRPQLQGLQRGGASQKIAEHMDHPEIEWDFEWNINNSGWDSTYQIYRTYLPSGEIAENVYYQHNGVSFVPFNRELLTYGAQPDPDRLVYYSWNGSAWDLAGKFESFDDLHGNLSDDVRYIWNGVSYDTSYAMHYDYSYVFGNLVSEKVTQAWMNGSVYVNQSRQTDSFPTAAGWDTETYYGWDGAQWVPSGRFTDAVWHNFQTSLWASYYHQSWNGSAWEVDSRTTGTFGSFDSPTYLYESWNGSTWDTTSKDVFVMDSLGHQTLSEHYDWNNGWWHAFGYRNDYIFDGQGNTVQSTYSYYDQGQYIPSVRFVYSNFFTEAASPSLATTSVTAYPNPCSDRLHFQLDLKQNGSVNIALYDLQGRLRMQMVTPAQAGSEITLPISELLENGTYVYRLQTKEGTATGKVAVQR